MTYLEWSQRFRLQPSNILVNNIIRFDGSLTPRLSSVQATYRAGDVAVTSILYLYLADTNTWEAQLAQLTSVFDPPGVTVMSDLVFCTESLFLALCSNGVLEHDLYVSAVAGNFTFDIKLIFFGLFNSFAEAWFDVTYILTPGIELVNSYVVQTDGLVAFSFNLIWEF